MPRASTWRLAAACGAAIAVASSCLLTSSFDDLTGGLPAPDGGSPTAGSGGQHDGGQVSSASASASVSVGSGGHGGAGGASASSGAGGAGGAVASSSASAGGGGAQGFPTTGLLDDFNRADGPPGPKWLLEDNGGFAINADQLATANGNPGTIVWTGLFGPVQEAWATFAMLDPTAVDMELVLKHQGAAQECESILVDYVPPVIFVDSCTAGTFSNAGSVMVSFSPGDQIGARALADGTVEVYKNGVQVGLFNVAAKFPFFAMGGHIGWADYGVNAQVRIDDFGGG